MLKHHSHLLSVKVDVGFFVGDIHSLKQYPPGGWYLQQIETSQESGLAGAGRANDNHNLPLANRSRYAVEGFDPTAFIMFLQLPRLNNIFTAHCFSASSPACLPGR